MTEPVKWSQEFLDQRMKEHRKWQERETNRLVRVVVVEVVRANEAYKRATA